MGDRQVIAAIALTIVLVITLVMSTHTPEATQEPQLLWRDSTAPPSNTLQI